MPTKPLTSNAFEPTGANNRIQSHAWRWMTMLMLFSGAVSVEAELVDGALRGLALGPGAITIELHNRSERVATAEVDATGWFELVLPTELRSRSELLRLQVLDAQGNHTWTDWFRS